MARTTRTDWLEEGLGILSLGGAAGVTVEKLCANVDRTKGAFYHHFRDMDAYLEALLDHWEAKHTTAPIIAAAGGTTAERRQRLHASVLQLGTRLEVAVRAWVLYDARAAQAVKRVDARRIDYLTELYAAAPGATPKKARQLGELEYVAFVGAQQLFPDLSTRRSQALRASLERALELLANDRDG